MKEITMKSTCELTRWKTCAVFIITDFRTLTGAVFFASFSKMVRITSCQFIPQHENSQTREQNTQLISIYLSSSICLFLCIQLSRYLSIQLGICKSILFYLLLSQLLPIHPALQSQTPEEELQLNEFSATHSQDSAQFGPKVLFLQSVHLIKRKQK